jgi:hypothetical protein
MSETSSTRIWLPRLVRISAAAANCSGSTVILVVITKSDVTITPESNDGASSPKSAEASQDRSIGGNGMNAIDVYSLKLIEISIDSKINSLAGNPSSSSVAAAENGMASVNNGIAHTQQRLAALTARRNKLPVTDPQEPRLRREMKAAREQLVDMQHAQRLLHRDLAAAVGGGAASQVLVDAALDARSAMSTEFNLSVHSDCASPKLADLNLSASSWPKSLRQSLLNEGLRIFVSDLAVATSADGSVTACSQGNAVQIKSKSIGQTLSQTLDMPNVVLAIALSSPGNLIAAAFTSMTGGRYARCCG